MWQKHFTCNIIVPIKKHSKLLLFMQAYKPFYYMLLVGFALDGLSIIHAKNYCFTDFFALCDSLSTQQESCSALHNSHCAGNET